MISNSDYPKIRKKIYFSEKFPSILKELKSRSKNSEIDKKLNKYWNPHKIPYIDFLNNGPYAVLSRSIASPNLEQLRFLRLAKRYNLKPVILEYDGKFVTKNTEKLSLCKMHFFTDKNNREYKIPEKISVANMNIYQGKNMSDIKTFENKSMVDFHHDLFWRYSNNKTCSLYNFTDWFNKTRVIRSEYYFYFLLIFMKNAILFDNYVLSDKSESEFIEQKILPSIDKVEKVFGKKPLIFPLLPFKNESSMKWLSYKQEVKEIVENTFKKG